MPSTTDETAAEETGPDGRGVRTARRRVVLCGAGLLVLAAVSQIGLREAEPQRAGGGDRDVSRWQAEAAAIDEGRRAAREIRLRLDPNRAGVREWALLPGIGPTLAERIVDHRRRRGRFESLEQLCEVPGVGPIRLQRIRPYLIALPPTELTTTKINQP
jgi:competence protein ComEA